MVSRQERLLSRLEQVQMAAFSQGGQERAIEKIQNLRERAVFSTFKVAVIGPFMSGKSTLIDTLLGQEILPVQLKTTNILEIKYGETPKVVFHFADLLPQKRYDGIPGFLLEHAQRFSLKDIPPLEVSLQEARENACFAQAFLKRIEWFLPLEILKEGIKFIEIPGLPAEPQTVEI